MSFSSDFTVPLITKLTQTWPFFNCGSENRRRFDMQISRRWHGQRSLGRAYILFLYPHLRQKMIISVYIIEQFSTVTYPDLFKLYLCGHSSQSTLSPLSVNRNSFASSCFIKHFNFIRSKYVAYIFLKMADRLSYKADQFGDNGLTLYLGIAE